MPASWQGIVSNPEAEVCFQSNGHWWDVVRRRIPGHHQTGWVVYGPGFTRELADVPRIQAMAVAEHAAFNLAVPSEGQG